MTKASNERTNLLANNLTFRDISWRNFDRASNTSYNNVLWRNFCTWDWLGAGRAVYQAAGAEWESLSSDDLRWGMPGTLCPDVENSCSPLSTLLRPRSSVAAAADGVAAGLHCPFHRFQHFDLSTPCLDIVTFDRFKTDSRVVCQAFLKQKAALEHQAGVLLDHGRFHRFWMVLGCQLFNCRRPAPWPWNISSGRCMRIFWRSRCHGHVMAAMGLDHIWFIFAL